MKLYFIHVENIFNQLVDINFNKVSLSPLLGQIMFNF
jgi:hypothetical protein